MQQMSSSSVAGAGGLLTPGPHRARQAKEESLSSTGLVDVSSCVFATSLACGSIMQQMSSSSEAGAGGMLSPGSHRARQAMELS